MFDCVGLLLHWLLTFTSQVMLIHLCQNRALTTWRDWSGDRRARMDWGGGFVWRGRYPSCSAGGFHRRTNQQMEYFVFIMCTYVCMHMWGGWSGGGPMGGGGDPWEVGGTQQKICKTLLGKDWFILSKNCRHILARKRVFKSLPLPPCA